MSVSWTAMALVHAFALLAHHAALVVDAFERCHNMPGQYPQVQSPDATTDLQRSMRLVLAPRYRLLPY